MNERYLFRGKRRDNGEWVQGNLCYFNDPVRFRADKWCAKIGSGLDMHNPHKLVDPATIGQCTGLRDKNDMLIFEGDHVSFYRNSDENYTGNVVWLDCCFQVQIGCRLQWEQLFYAGGCYEIIGNIHDNPGLLEDGGNGSCQLSDQCAECGSIHLQPSGSCKVCVDCGTTTGCS